VRSNPTAKLALVSMPRFFLALIILALAVLIGAFVFAALTL
jgi:hypothetical protein